MQIEVSPEEAASYTGYPVKIYCFTGPLDLLLHLVRSHQVDIAEVPVAEVTQQYLEYLRTMQAINIEMSGEFVVTASTLSYIKSKSLLPPEPEADKEEEVGEDPARELQQRLREYQIYKEAASHLEAARRVRERIFLRPLAEEAGLESGYVTLEGISLFDMVGAVNELIKQTAPEPTGRVTLPSLTVPDRLEEILLRLEAEGQEVSFAELVGRPATRSLIIVTFLALLELMRSQRIEVRQEQLRGPIYIRRVEAPTGES